MLLWASFFNLLDLGLFLFMGSVLAGSIWLYRSSMEHLRALKEQQQQQYEHLLRFLDKPASQKAPSLFQKWIQPLTRIKRKEPAITIASPAMSTVDLLAVKKMLEQQQKVSQQLLLQIEQLQAPQKPNKKETISELEDKLTALELLIEHKDEQIRQLVAQQEVTEKLLGKMEAVQQDYEEMQQRIASLEQGAVHAPRLAMELEDSQLAWLQAQQEITKKSNKLQLVLSNNVQLSEQLAQTEDKLQVATAERQQLFKKVQLLENLNKEMQEVSDANRKLHTEMRRISELESMLNMITEERNQLLHK
jgi:chromosome segregation ATPase